MTQARSRSILALILAALLISACGAQASVSPSPAATPTPQATPTPVLSQHYEITAQDSGQAYVYSITSRFQIILDGQTYPKERLTVACTPATTLGSISNLPAVAPPLYAVRYEGVTPGLCTISDGNFTVTVRIVAL